MGSKEGRQKENRAKIEETSECCLRDGYVDDGSVVGIIIIIRVGGKCMSHSTPLLLEVGVGSVSDHYITVVFGLSYTDTHQQVHAILRGGCVTVWAEVEGYDALFFYNSVVSLLSLRVFRLTSFNPSRRTRLQ